MKHISVRSIAYLGVLAAMGVVLAALRPVNLWDVRVSFTFVPVAAAAILFGPLSAAVVGALIDVLGAILFPTGSFFPGFTLTAAVQGAIFGLLLYQRRRDADGSDGTDGGWAASASPFRRPGTWLRPLAAALLSALVCTLALNTLWISVLNGVPFVPLLLRRLIQAAVMAPVQFAVLLFLRPALLRAFPRVS